MRFKTLLFMFLWATIAFAQNYAIALNSNDTINYLIISEYRGENPGNAYIQLTNMGTEPVDLSHFQLGHWGGPAHTLDYETGKTGEASESNWFSEAILEPGESYLIAAYRNEWTRNWELGLDFQSTEKVLADELREKADLLVRQIEMPDLWWRFQNQWGGNGLFIRQMLFDEDGEVVDSLVVDQVGGTFVMEGGGNPGRTDPESHYPVAGVESALRNARLIRKADITTGTLDFNAARGVGLEDSEWVAIPFEGGPWRAVPWTIKEHGHYTLDEHTLVSDAIDVDFDNKTLTIPWGVVRGDDIMNYFEYSPNVAWTYIMAGEADSLAHAAQTGDVLRIYLAGNSLETADFDIVVADPAPDANSVVSRSPIMLEDFWTTWVASGVWPWPRVTKHEAGNDTIWGVHGGIPYATRVDSLLVRLDKPDNAEWEIVYESGVEKPDLSHGDKILVTAEDGSEKEYYISMNDYSPSSNADLSAIHWPDIPDFYRGLFGWRGDTIPGFTPTAYSYTVEVPLDVPGIPALVAKPVNLNAKVEVDRATNLAGTREDRTTTFNVTADDDTTKVSYSVLLRKEQDFENQQPYHADPFISEVVNNWWWDQKYFMEIVNPGNQPIDLSYYMLAGHQGAFDPAGIIATTNAENWENRYDKFIPGRKWTAEEAEWLVQPYIAERDLSVDAMLYPGETFTMGWVRDAGRGFECDMQDWYPGYHVDVQFNNSNLDSEVECEVWVNHWGEAVNGDYFYGGGRRGAFFARSPNNNPIYLFKILNDSVRDGTKPASDPNDFELIDFHGMEEGGQHQIDGVFHGVPSTFIRKPHVYQGNPVPGAAFGSEEEEGEYIAYTHHMFGAQGLPFPERMLAVINDIGTHYMEEPTHYMSTVASLEYIVSEGYESPQEIRGVVTGTTVSQFLANIIKMNEEQTLNVSTAAGTDLTDDDLVLNDFILTVVSADSTNTTDYILEVTDDGLSDDASLSSAVYDVEIDVEPSVSEGTHIPGSGTISGFDYETLLKTVVNELTPAPGARMAVIDSRTGGYAPFRKVNFDTTYVDVTANPELYVEVIAEDNATIINYALQPESSSSDAFVISYVYSVIQEDFLIQLVPRGTSVRAFLSNVIPVSGATIKLIDNMGFERTTGGLADDDRLFVTSEDGTVENIYFIAMLPTEFIPGVFYLAYILSDVYSIDQVEHVIYDAEVVDVSVFHENIRTVAGATAVVVDEDGVEKTSGNIEESDIVVVTSLDGKIQVEYTFGPLTDATGTEFFAHQSQLEFYPNPTRGNLNVLGVEPGQRISVYTIAGLSVLEIDVRSNVQAIPLQDLNTGMYMIIVTNKDGSKAGVFKAIKN